MCLTVSINSSLCDRYQCLSLLLPLSPFPFLQIWMRCFTPVDVKHRDRLWRALAPSPLDSPEVNAGRWHRQLVCGLVTLFAQVGNSINTGYVCLILRVFAKGIGSCAWRVDNSP